MLRDYHCLVSNVHDVDDGYHYGNTKKTRKLRAPKITSNMFRVFWQDSSAEDVYNLFRALQPKAIWTMCYKGVVVLKEVSIYKHSLAHSIMHKHTLRESGIILSGRVFYCNKRNGIVIHCGRGGSVICTKMTEQYTPKQFFGLFAKRHTNRALFF